MPAVPFADSRTGRELVRERDAIVDPGTGAQVARVVRGIPRFVEPEDDYAASFGWQWNRWDLLSDAQRGRDNKRAVVLERTGFADEDLDGKTLLECGCGRGDDTEVLLGLPLAEVHSFDLSNAVDQLEPRAADRRLVASQASIYEIPYADETFDIVYCHRVLQHTPDPAAALRAICRKVKPGGLLFAHSYKRSFRYMNKYKYKYRPLTRRLSPETMKRFVDRFGARLYGLHERTHDSNAVVDAFLHSFVPFERLEQYGDFSRDEMIELAKLVTFDALTPRYDRPMTSRKFRGIVEGEGFEFRHLVDPKVSPIYGTARKIR